MQARGRQLGVTLRPHAKTHKIAQIAQRQLAAGGVGLTVATVAEAEAFAAAGFDDLFIAYPLWVDADRGARLAALARHARVRVGCDSADAARQLGQHTVPAIGTDPGQTGGLEVLVEVDSGMHRSGVEPQQAGGVGVAAREAGLSVVGVFTFPGHSYAVDGGRRAAAEQEGAALTAAAQSLREVGIEPRVVSGGSSPSMEFASSHGVSEMRPGVYVVADAQQWELGVCEPADVALTVYATVVSHASGRAVLDCGSKALGADRAPYATGSGRLLDHPDARIVMLSEHHAVADCGPDPLPPLGSVVRVVPNHACNALNLADEVAVVGEHRPPGGGPAATIAHIWPLIARNANH